VARTLEQVRLEPTFPAFAAWCRARGVTLQIVSDGMDRVIHTLLAREGVMVDSVRANHLVESPSGELSLAFPVPSKDRSCGAGLCKCQALKDAHQSVFRVVIGDGRSDWCWARQADLVFAKSELLSYCNQQEIPCRPFAGFDTIQRALEPLVKLPARRAMGPRTATPASRYALERAS